MSDLKGKKLLILAGAGVHCRLVQTAKDMGVYTIVTDYLSDSPAKKIADESWMLNITDVDAIVERCKAEGVDGVLNVCIDPAQRPYQKICEELNLPCFGTEEQFYILTDKPAFKQFCLQSGVDVIPEYSIRDLREGKIKFPVFVKPVDSRGSRGQTICQSADELEEAIAFASNESSNGQYIIERYMGGLQDFSMTYLICDGIPCLVRTADRHLGRFEDGLSRQTIASISPSIYTGMCMKHVEKHTRNFVERLGIINGPVLMQGFVEENRIYMYDPGLRFPGNEYERMYAKATGVNLMKIMVEFALGNDIGKYSSILKGSCLLNGKRIIQIMYNISSGKVARIEGMEKIREREEVLDIQQRYFVGDIVPDSGDIRQRACEIDILIDDNPEQIKEIINFVNTTLHYFGDEGEDMHISAIDAQEMAELYR